MTSASFRHLGTSQRLAATAALDQLTEQRQTKPSDDTINAWVKALWTRDGKGVIDPGAAIRALEAFCDRAPKAQPAVLGTAILSAKNGGLQLRSLAKDDGADWKDSVDLSGVDARVDVMKADLAWVFSLDLTDPIGFQTFGKWVGNRWGTDEPTSGSSWTDHVAQGCLFGALSSRHGLPSAIAKPYLEQALTDDKPTRTRQGEMFGAIAEKHARGVYEREAKFEAFLDAAPQLYDRIRSGRLDQEDLRKEVETELGLEPDTIGSREFDIMLQEANRDHDDQFGRLTDRGGYIRQFAIDHVLGAVSDQRIADALITTGMDVQLASESITDDEAIAALEKKFGVPEGGIEPRVFYQGVSSVKIFKSSYETYGR